MSKINIPQDVLNLVSLQLDLKNWFNFRLTCKQFNRAALQYVNRKISIKSRRSTVFDEAIFKAEWISDLTIRSTDGVYRLIELTKIGNLTRLLSLNLRGGRQGRMLIDRSLLLDLTRLNCLSLSSVTIILPSLERRSSRREYNLRELNLDNVTGTSYLFELMDYDSSKLEVIRITENPVWDLIVPIANLQNLKEVVFNNCFLLTHEMLGQMVSIWKTRQDLKLRNLKIRECRSLQDQGLDLICMLTSLESLTILGMPQIVFTPLLSRLSNLKYLDFSGTGITTDQMLELLEKQMGREVRVQSKEPEL